MSLLSEFPRTTSLPMVGDQIKNVHSIKLSPELGPSGSSGHI